MKIIGIGNTAEVIEQDDGKVCKLFYEGYPIIAINSEYNNAIFMKKTDISMPEVYDIVNVGKRVGIVYSKIQGESMLEKLLQGGDIKVLLENLADLHKKILQYNTDEVMSYKEFLKLSIIKDANFNLDIYDEIEKLPEGKYLCHGDYHPGNVFVDDNDKLIVIDFMNVCYGPWQYDVARTYFLLSEGNIPNDIPNREEILYMKKQVAEMYLKLFDVSYNDISKYISIIKKCWKYEQY